MSRKEQRLEELRNKREKKSVLKKIWNVIYFLLVIATLMLLVVVVLQRVSNNTISIGGFRIFNIVSESMIPKYQIGDVLLSKNVDINEIKIGDDVVYIGEEADFKDRIVTHQVIDIEKYDEGIIFHTKGIANDVEDPVIRGHQIYGVIVGRVPIISNISKMISNLYSMYFIVFIPMAILIFVEVKKFIYNLKDDEEFEDEEEIEEEDEENN